MSDSETPLDKFRTDVVMAIIIGRERNVPTHEMLFVLGEVRTCLAWLPSRKELEAAIIPEGVKPLKRKKRK